MAKRNYLCGTFFLLFFVIVGFFGTCFSFVVVVVVVVGLFLCPSPPHLPYIEV